MSGPSKLLKADGFQVRCAANKRYAVAIRVPSKNKLSVTKRTDAVSPLTAEIRRIVREMPNKHVYVFDLVTGALIYKHWANDEAPADGVLARAILNGGLS